MDEMEFDRTRKAIQADQLDQGSRKDMFQKLTSAGGEVQDERSVRKEGSDRGGRPNSGERVKLPSELARERAREEAERRARLRQELAQAERAATGFLARFLIKLKCKMSGLTPYGRNEVLPPFMSKLNLNLKRTLMECRLLADDLLARDENIGRTIVKELDAKQPLYIELLERGAALYDKKEISQLTESYTEDGVTPVPLEILRAPLFSILRKLYYMKAFQETYIAAAEAAIDIQARLEKKQTALYASKKNTIRRYWRETMNGLYPSMVLLAQRTLMKAAESGTPLFEDMLDIRDEDRLGRRRRGETADLNPDEFENEPDLMGEASGADDASNISGETASAPQAAGEGEAGATGPAKDASGGPTPEEELFSMEEDGGIADLEFNENETDENFHPGVEIMRSLSMDDLRKLSDTGGDLNAMPDKDKILISFLFFKFFEEEYGFLMTTQKAALAPSYIGGKKQDYRQMLSDLYQETRGCEESFRQYKHENGEYQKALEESGQVSNYVEYAKKIQMLENRRGGSGRDSRIRIMEFMQKVSRILAALIQDMDISGPIVLNKNEIIKFERIAGAKRLNGVSVSSAIREAHDYAQALALRLEGGDLFGGVIEMSDAEYARAFPVRRKPSSDASLESPAPPS